MLPITKILLPVDFSAFSLGAARHAAVFAQKYRSEITCLHVVTAGDGDAGKGHADLLDTFLRSLVTNDGHEILTKQVLLEGDPAVKIIEYADSNNTDFIVMATHGYGPFRRFILGSVTAKMLHDAACPVLTGAHLEDAPVSRPPSIHRILCAVDLRNESTTTLRWAGQLAADFHAHLDVVHALPSFPSGVWNVYSGPEWNSTIAGMARQEIGALQEAAGTHAGVHVEPGDAAEVVSRVAERVGADLLVIGRSSGDGAAGRLRTHSYSIIRQSPCPVLSL